MDVSKALFTVCNLLPMTLCSFVLFTILDHLQINVVPSDSQLDHLKTETAEAAEKAKRFAQEESKKLNRNAKKAEKRCVKDVVEGVVRRETNGNPATVAVYPDSLAKRSREVSSQVQEGWGHLSSDPKAWGTVLGAGESYSSVLIWAVAFCDVAAC